MHYINVAKSFWVDNALKNDSLKKPRDSDEQLLQGRSLSSPKYFSCYRMYGVHALCNVALGEELLGHYRNKYEFYACSRTY